MPSCRRVPSCRVPAALLVLVAALLAFGAAPAGAAFSSTATPTVAANGLVETVVQGNGQLFLGGSFSRVGTPDRSLAALDTTTGITAPGFPQTNGTVTAILPDGGGGLYVGGTFTVISGAARNRLAHITSSGSVDGFDPDVNGAVNALALSGTTLYAGGAFTTANGATTRNGVAAFDTTQPTANVRPFNPNVSGTVSALAVSGTTLFAGGAFTGANSVNGTTTRNALAAFDTTQATANVLPFNPNPNSAVNALVLSGTTLYVAGNFNTVNGSTRRARVAALDTSQASTQALPTVLPFDPEITARANALALSGTTLYVGGTFNGANSVNGTVTRNRVAAFDTTQATNNVLPFDPNINSTVNALAISGTTLYVGGIFNGANTVNGSVARDRLAAFDTTKATANVLPFDPDADSGVLALTISGGTLYAGGSFTFAGSPDDAVRNNLASVDTSTGSVTAFDPNVTSAVNALVLTGSTLYVGGDFVFVNGTVSRRFAAAFDTTRATANVLPFNPNFDGSVFALALSGTTLYAGGRFHLANGSVTRNALAALDTSQPVNNLLPFNPNLNSAVNALALSGTTLYAGGNFGGPNSVNGTVTRSAVAAFDTTQATNNVLPFDPNITDTVNALALSGTTLYAGGLFAGAGSVNGSVTRNRVAAFDTTQPTANVLPFDPNLNGNVRALLLSGTTLYAGGDFNGTGSVNGSTTRNRLAAFDTTRPTANVLPFNPDLDNQVWGLSLSGATLYAGGFLTSAGTTVAPNLAKFVDQAPTAVRWRGGAARALAGRRGVRVTWSTGLESDNLGFDVLRVRRGHHTRVRVTRKLILGGTLSRRSYRFTDTTGRRGDRYYVIDRDLRGHATIHPLGTAA